MRNVVLPLLLISFCFLQGCKKDEDTTAPSVIIDSPSENSNFNVFDTAAVRFTVSDETALSSVSVGLVNSQFIPVAPEVNVSIQGPSFSATINYHIYDVRLGSGVYYFRVRASDGVNETNAFKKN